MPLRPAPYYSCLLHPTPTLCMYVVLALGAVGVSLTQWILTWRRRLCHPPLYCQEEMRCVSVCVCIGSVCIQYVRIFISYSDTCVQERGPGLLYSCSVGTYTCIRGRMASVPQCMYMHICMTDSSTDRRTAVSSTVQVSVVCHTCIVCTNVAAVFV